MKQLLVDWRNAFSEIEGLTLSRSVQYTALGLIVGLILVIRLAGIGNPSLRWTAWKEIDYLYISQNYADTGFDFLRPEVGWPAEPPRVTEMEIPLVPFTTALFYKLFGLNAYSARITTLFAALLMMVYVYKLVLRELGPVTALLATLAAGVLPLHHPFGRLLFTEPVMIAMSVVSLYYIAEWIDHERPRDGFLAFAAFSLTVALKLESLYLFLPIAYLAFRKYGFDVKRYGRLTLMIGLALILPVLWYSYAYYLETTGAHLFGIFKGHDKSQTITMLSTLKWYRTMAGRVINDILGGFYGTFLFIAGLAVAAWFRKGRLFFSYLGAVLIYFVLVAEGNVDAPYRQLPLVPSASLFIAMGVQAILAGFFAMMRLLRRARINTSQSIAPAVLLAGFSMVFVVPVLNIWDVIGNNAPWHGDRWEVAQVVADNSSEADKIVVLGEYSKHVGGYDLSPVLYYYSGRQGWTLTPPDWNLEKIDALIQRGATLLVRVHPYEDHTAANYQPEESSDPFVLELSDHYPILYQNEGQVVFDLSQPKSR